MHLSCPVPVDNDDTCGADINVDVNPCDGVSGILRTACHHMAELESGKYDDDLVNQAIEKDAELYSAEIDRRIDARRERELFRD